MGLLRQGRDRRCTAIAIPSRLRLSRRPAMGRSSETGWLASHLWRRARHALYARRRRTDAGRRRPTRPPARGQVRRDAGARKQAGDERSEEHTSELQSLMRISYAVFCLKKKNNKKTN